MKFKSLKIIKVFFFFSASLIIFFNTNHLVNYKNLDNWPVLGYYTITSEYGERISPITGNRSFHYGIDIGAPEGSKLLAIMDSEVKFTGFIIGYGCTIKLESKNENNTIEMIYSHVSPNYIISRGMQVFKGDHIGYGGPKYINLDGEIILNGNTTGPHLHFEIKINNINVDPILFLNSLDSYYNETL